MLRFLLIGLVACLLASAGRASGAPDWEGSLVPQDVQATCRALTAKYPDLAAAGADHADPHCVSADLYDGTNAPPDAAAARQCALRELNSPDPPIIGGAAVLMMIYANGDGVARDLGKAAAYACLAGGAPAEITGRLHHLQGLETKAPGAPLKACQKIPDLPAAYCHGIVDICDDITSGFMEGACAARASANQAARKTPALRGLVASWSQDAQRAFAVLEQAADAYFAAHADREIDLSGTGRAAFEIQAKDDLRAVFQARLMAFEQGRFPAPQNPAAADRALNARYAAAMKAAGADPASGITPAGIRSTERLWLKYRDAWLHFATIHYKNINPTSLATTLTTDRTTILKELSP